MKLKNKSELAISKIFQQHYTDAFRIFSSPGRINLIGEHTDYNLGFVLPAAIDYHIHLAINKSNNKQFSQIRSLDFEEVLTIDHHNQVLQKGSWKSYIQACCLILSKAGYSLEGIQCVIRGDIPIGAGLSSSAALTCGFIYALDQLLELKLSKVEIAKMAQAAEHLIGVNCGIMDQFAVLFGKKDYVFKLDCRDLSYQYFPITLREHELVLINSRVKHELVDTAYNDRRADCEFVLSKLQERFPEVTSLRDIDIKKLNEIKAVVSPTQLQRVQYILEENQRVIATCQALEDGNLEQVGTLLYASHQGLSKDYEVSCSELDLLVDLSKKSEGILGSRMMGGGFGGCTINLLPKNQIQTIEQIMEKYEIETGIKPSLHAIKTGGGVREMGDVKYEI